jgi:hypothetical protein
MINPPSEWVYGDWKDVRVEPPRPQDCPIWVYNPCWSTPVQAINQLHTTLSDFTHWKSASKPAPPHRMGIDEYEAACCLEAWRRQSVDFAEDRVADSTFAAGWKAALGWEKAWKNEKSFPESSRLTN